MSALRTATLPIRRLPRLPRLVVRPLVLAFLWSRRHTVLLWWRTLRGALSEGGARDLAGLRVLVRALVRVSADGRVGNAPELRRLRLAGDALDVDVDAHWARRGVLRAVLNGVDGVNEVRLGADEPVPGAADAVLEPIA